MKQLLGSMILMGVGMVSAPGYADCAPNANITTTKPNMNYMVHGTTGTVTDVTTGLMWMVCSYGQTFSAGTCSAAPAASTLTWSGAFAAAVTVNAAPATSGLGYSDWRVPNVNELVSLLDRSCNVAPRINSSIFNNPANGAFWSSTPSKGTAGSAWSVNFTAGDVNVTSKNDTTRYVRLVRNAQ